MGLGLTDGIWRMMQECWGGSDRRWTISRIVSCLESLVAPTVKMVGSDERAGAQGQAFTLVPHSGSPSGSGPELEVIRPNRRKNFFRKLNQLFCV